MLSGLTCGIFVNFKNTLDRCSLGGLFIYGKHRHSFGEGEQGGELLLYLGSAADIYLFCAHGYYTVDLSDGITALSIDEKTAAEATVKGILKIYEYTAG